MSLFGLVGLTTKKQAEVVMTSACFCVCVVRHISGGDRHLFPLDVYAPFFGEFV